VITSTARASAHGGCPGRGQLSPQAEREAAGQSQALRSVPRRHRAFRAAEGSSRCLPAPREGLTFPAPARRRASSDNPSTLQTALAEGFNYISREQSQRVGQPWTRSQLTHWRSQCPLHQPRTQAKRRPERQTAARSTFAAH